MADHAAVWSGDQRATLEMLLRLARQAVRRHNTPSPRRGSGWATEDYEDLLGNLFADKCNILEVALLNTTTDRALELYSLSTIENYLRDRARSTELGKLIDRLKTILGQEPQFFRHTASTPPGGSPQQQTSHGRAT